MSLSSLLTAVLLSCSLGMGCHLYLDDEDHDRDVREPRPTEPCSGQRCGPQEAPPDAGYVVVDGAIGDSCSLDIQCGPGCYCTPDGVCEQSSTRPDATIFACSEISSEADCSSYDQCSAVFRGINCVAEDGSSCTSDSVNCQCESFVFDRCEDA
jgi:hypothetical protein